MEYKDALGAEIKVGDHIVYYSENRGMQIGKVLDLIKGGYDGKQPTLKVQGARRKGYYFQGNYDFEKMDRASRISKLENVVVLNNNLNAIVTLM